ncbi:MAG: hypothetical protein GXP62_10080 [Oligoflexia bacterium]|nr:hypothetical protein [Oligoflexia bacterium]
MIFGVPLRGLSAAALAGATLVASGTASAASVCKDVATVPSSLQVAWIAPLGRRVGASATLEVVRVGDLRAAAHGITDPVRLLQMVGMLSRRPTKGQQDGAWQVVIFDVDADWLCRPIEDAPPGDLQAGVSVCAEDHSGPTKGHRKGWTGCGYSLDTGASTRGLDVYRVDWETASRRGFCLMPLQRFLEGA